jgi:hypothetical protein
MQLAKGRLVPACDFFPFGVEVGTHRHLGPDSTG